MFSKTFCHTLVTFLCVRPTQGYSHPWTWSEVCYRIASMVCVLSLSLSTSGWICVCACARVVSCWCYSSFFSIRACSSVFTSSLRTSDSNKSKASNKEVVFNLFLSRSRALLSLVSTLLLLQDDASLLNMTSDWVHPIRMSSIMSRRQTWQTYDDRRRLRKSGIEYGMKRSFEVPINGKSRS